MSNLFQNKLISIILPVFNGANYINKCLGSLRLQSYKNYEVIIIDNNSNDNSIDLIQNFISLNKNIKINFLKNYTNIGFIGSINLGLSKVSIDAEYIYIICVDDWIESNFLDDAISTLEENADCSMLCSATKLDKVGETTKFIGNIFPPGVYNGAYISKMWFLYTFYCGLNLFTYPVGIVFRRGAANSIPHFDINLGSPSDVDFFIRLIMNSKIVFTEYIGAHVLDHNDQQNKKYKNSGELLLNQKKLIHKHFKFLQKVKIIHYIKFITLSSSFLRYIRFGDNPAQYSYLKILLLGPFALIIRVFLYILKYR